MTLEGARALFLRALALEDQGRPAEALVVYSEVLARHPDDADARHNFGLLLARMGRLRDAEESHRLYTRSHPQSVRAWNDLADILLATGDYEGAVSAVASMPQADASGLVRRGVGLSSLGRFADAREAFRQALALNAKEVERFAGRIAGPGGDLETMLSPENIFVGRHYLAQKACEWSRWNEDLEQVRSIFRDPQTALEPATGYMALLFPFSGQERLNAAAHVAGRIEAKNPALPTPPRRKDGARIRVGVLSPDLREHVNAYLLLPLFELLNRQHFEVRAYSLAPADGSLIGKRVRNAADALVELQAASDAEAAARIRSDDIDILLDVAGHTTGGRFGITVRRPARVQGSYLGFLGSLGSKRVDFAIVDRLIAPESSEWTESLVHLPHTFFLYDFRERPAELPVMRREYGLPEDAFVYCAFHQESKITPDTFRLWMDILDQVPRSVLWFRAVPPATAASLLRQGALHGIDPARLIFAPFEARSSGRYFARHRLGDVLLDAPHHNAINSACDALGAGLPVLTLPGDAPAARAGKSIACAAGLDELVAKDRATFIDLAIKLATQPGILRHFKEQLAANRSQAPLFDTRARVRELEQAFRKMMEGVR